MEILWQELTTGLHGADQLERGLLRLVAAVLLVCEGQTKLTWTNRGQWLTGNDALTYSRV